MLNIAFGQSKYFVDNLVDKERAPLVKKMFETYATGKYTLSLDIIGSYMRAPMSH